jgi:glycosyltransferase involved in cell wall biosynthesis
MKGQTTLNVGLNAHLLSRQAGYRSAGIHSYIQHLIHHLPTADEHLGVTVFTGQSRTGEWEALARVGWQNSRWPTHQPWMRVAWEQLVQPWALHRSGVQLLHAMAFVSPLLELVPTVVTVHDLSFLRFPDRFRPAKRLYLSTLTRISCRRARRIIAVSHATAAETERLLDVPAERIDVVPHGVEHTRFRPLPDSKVETARHEIGMPERFVLFLGTLEPRKNLCTLIEAFARIGAARQGIKLVIAGGKGWYYQEVFDHVERVRLEEAVLFPGFVPDDELPLWYNAATVFAYPSLYEGFGMPLLEAMACGTPVIGADTSCMPEVIGDAGVLVSPDDIDGLAVSLERLLVDAELRADLGQRGQARAASYTWEAAAKATVASYRRALTN